MLEKDEAEWESVPIDDTKPDDVQLVAFLHLKIELMERFPNVKLPNRDEFEKLTRAQATDMIHIMNNMRKWKVITDEEMMI